MAAIQIVKIDYSIIEYFSMINGFDNESEEYKRVTIEEFKNNLTKALNNGPGTKEIVWINKPEKIKVKKNKKSKKKTNVKLQIDTSLDYVKEVVIDSICKISHLDIEELYNNANFNKTLVSELGFDDLDIVELVMEIEKNLDICISDEICEIWFKENSINKIIEDVFKIVSEK